MFELITQSVPHLLYLKVRAAGYPIDNQYPFAHMRDSRTDRVMTTSQRYARGWHLAAWNPLTRKWFQFIASRSVVYVRNHLNGFVDVRFDTYNDAIRTESQLAFNEMYESIPVGYRVLMVGNHAPTYFSNEMRTNMIDAGASIEKTGWQGGAAPGASGFPAYILLGTKGIGEGNAQIEVLNNLPAIEG